MASLFQQAEQSAHHTLLHHQGNSLHQRSIQMIQTDRRGRNATTGTSRIVAFACVPTRWSKLFPDWVSRNAFLKLRQKIQIVRRVC